MKLRAGIAIRLLSTIGGTAANAAVVVPATASGGFGDPNTGFVPMVVGHVFSGSTSVSFVATGIVNRFDASNSAFDNGPDGEDIFFGSSGQFPSISTYLPLEEVAADVDPGAFTFPRENVTLLNSGVLMYAFVPEARVNAPGFQALDEDLTTSGIMASELTLAGANFTFNATEPGTLFFGVNDSIVDNNSGQFEVTVVPIPSAFVLLILPVLGLTFLRRLDKAAKLMYSHAE